MTEHLPSDSLAMYDRMPTYIRWRSFLTAVAAMAAWPIAALI